MIAQNVAYGPDWGSSGWITFTGTDYQIWKVRENGDSLIRLTNTGDYCNYAKWSPNGQLILYKDAASGTMKVIDANGNLILERHINIPVWYWYSDNEIMTTDQFISTSTTNFVLFNLYDSLFTTLHSVTGFGLWHFNQYSFRHKKAIVVNTIPPFYQQNVYVIDINSFHLDSLRNAESQSFSKGHEVFLKDHIICYRDCRDTTDDDCVLKVQQYLSIMDADGSNERRILLPE